jgi:hypothetical protein
MCPPVLHDEYRNTGGTPADNTYFIDQTVDVIVSLLTIYDTENKFKLTLVSKVGIYCNVIASQASLEFLQVKTIGT